MTGIKTSTPTQSMKIALSQPEKIMHFTGLTTLTKTLWKPSMDHQMVVVPMDTKTLLSGRDQMNLTLAENQASLVTRVSYHLESNKVD